MSDPQANTPGQASRRLLNATAVMASGTLVSRILGFAKATLLVIVLGAANPQADSFSLATLVPNTLYMLFAGGALNTVLVPQIVRHAKNDADGGEAFINRIMTAFLAALVAVTALATVLTPWVMSLYTNALWRAPDMADHWQQLVFLSFLTMPQLFFYGAFFLVGQVLNARDKFGPMMWAPILNNVVGIGVLGVYLAVWGTNAAEGVPAFTDQQVLVLGLGSTLGIIVQTLALAPSLRALGIRYRPRWDLKGQGLGETFHLAKWMLGYVLLTTIVQMVVTNLASTATVLEKDAPGAGITAYNTAYLVWILPHSLLTVSLATALMPSASRLAAAHDLGGVAAEVTRTMRLALTFLVPSSLAFIALGLPFSQLAFGHGSTAQTWPFIGWTLVAFAFGLIPYTIQYVYLRGFYALEDTRSAFVIQLGISVVNIAAALALIAVDNDPMTVAPRLALAYALSYAVGAWLTHGALKRHLPALSGGEVLQHTTQLLVAALPGALAAGLISFWASDRGTGMVLAGFLGSLAIAGLTFFLVARRLGIQEVSQLGAVLRRRPVPEPSGSGTGAVHPGDDAPASAPDADDLPEGGVSGLLEYPDPEEIETPIGPNDVSDLPGGTVLNGRYRLDRALNRRGSTVTWLGFDLNLGRPVLMHVLDHDEPRALEILDEARKAAPATDSRFLRVWDAVLDETGGHGSYIVCEYAPGQSLELALRSGTFSDVETAWLVREVAAGLVAMHAQGLHHRQLNPDTVVVTASGNVKIVGFLVEQALHPAAVDPDGERADVQALGELLYAAVLGRWPGPSRYGLAAAPTDALGRPLAPRAVSTRVSQELSDIIERILFAQPGGRTTPLTTVSASAESLSALLGGTDASHLLQERLRFPIEHVRITAPRPPRTDLLATPLGIGYAGARLTAPVPGADVPDAGDAVAALTVDLADDPPGGLTEDLPDDLGGEHPDDVIGPLRGRPDARPASPWGNPAPDSDPDDVDESTAAFWLDDVDDDEEDTAGTAPFTPVPPPKNAFQVSQQAPSKDPPRRWQGLLFVAFALALVLSLVLVFANAFTRSRTPAPAPAPTPYGLVAARDFDPRRDGGDNAENSEQARLVLDGDPNTAWTTERYGRSANFNGRKPGVGVIVDLGEAKPVAWVSVLLGDGPTTGEIRVPVRPDQTTPPMDGRDAWRVVGEFAPSTGDVSVRIDRPVTTRFVLVYLTNLPKDGANYVGSIREIRVTA